MEAGTFVVLMPSGLRPEEEQRHVDTLLARYQRSQAKQRLDSEDLTGRARRLSATYLDGRAAPTSITWVTNQQHRWGSCSPATGTIRLSTALDGMPSWVVDSVIVHELAHLVEANHGPRFKALVSRFERYDEATAFLRGVSFAQGRPADDDDSPSDIETA